MNTHNLPIACNSTESGMAGNVAPAKSPTRMGRWVARFGVAGFCFFLIKGLLWLIVPALVVAFR